MLATQRLTKLTPSSVAMWSRKNLFNNWYNSVITVAMAASVLFVISQAISWVVGSDFQIIRHNLALFMVGKFPRDELWRPWLASYMLMGSVGFGSGVLWRAALHDAKAKGLPVEPHSWLDILRRFWAVIAVLALFVSFARTFLPYLGLAGVFAVIVVARELGRKVDPKFQSRALYSAGFMGVASQLVLAGSRGLGALAMAGLLASWASVEVRGFADRRGAGSIQASPYKRRRFTIRYPLNRRIGALLAAPLAAVVVGLGSLLLLNRLPFSGFGWEDWGGLHLTLFVTVIGVGAGFPMGLLLALGRKSSLPVIKGASVAFIEFVRGVPLISLLLFSSFMLPLLFPSNREFPGPLTRAMIVIAAFSAAYIAEIVRGGLAAVPKGQIEAAQASGLSARKIQRFIVLPQALRAVIPAMVGQFISLFKDTSLLYILGLLEFLRASTVANAQVEFLGQGLANVTLPFVAIGYWAFAYTMSKESRRIEHKLGVGVR